jgi:hypothetical protein
LDFFLTLYIYIIQAGGKKLKGFMSSAKKESLFRTSETGRVGFTGSGKGMVIKKKINKKESLFRTYETVRVGFTGSDEVVIVYKPNPNWGVKQTLF